MAGWRRVPDSGSIPASRTELSRRSGRASLESGEALCLAMPRDRTEEIVTAMAVPSAMPKLLRHHTTP